MLMVGWEFLKFLLSGRAGEHPQVNPVGLGDALVLAAPGLEEKSWGLLG